MPPCVFNFKFIFKVKILKKSLKNDQKKSSQHGDYSKFTLSRSLSLSNNHNRSLVFEVSLLSVIQCIRSSPKRCGMTMS